MAKTVLVQRSSSIYNDEAGTHYHFPKRYLRRVQEASGDWVVFFSPVKDNGISKESRGCYFATARLGEILKDLKNEDLYYAKIDPQTYASFSNPVNRKQNGSFIEKALAGKNGRPNTGVALQAVRNISEEEFQQIISLAWLEKNEQLPRETWVTDTLSVREEQTPFAFNAPRETTSSLVNRKIRDKRFRQTILNAYEKKCAITGWTFINGGGRAEVEAAHIKPVQNNGPDSIQNGLALSGTIHWMFDRGLIGVSDNDEILISRKVNDRISVERLLNPTKKLIKPKRQEHHPHPAFLKWHRENHNLEAA